MWGNATRLALLGAIVHGCSARSLTGLRSAPAQVPVREHANTSPAIPSGPPHQNTTDIANGHKGISEQEVHVPWVMLPIAAGLVSSVVFFIYGPRGPSVVASVLVYLLSLSTMKLSVKWVFATNAYPYAKFVSALHFAAGGMVCYCILLRRKVPIPVPTAQEFLTMICPIALAMAFSIGANNMALVFASAAFTEIIGATNCLITIGMVVLMGMPFNKWLVLPCSVVAFGCALGTVGELNFSLLGMLLCLLSNVFRSLKVALQQKLMTGETKDKFDPTALLFWISIPSMAVMMAGSIATEGLAPFRALAGREASALHGLLFAVLMSCVNATILNLSQLYVTKDLGAVGGQLVAQAKMVLTVLGGMVLFGETFSQLEVVGFLISLIGVFAFSRMDQAFKESQQKSKESV